MDEGHTTEVGRGEEARHITNDAARECDDRRPSLQSVVQQSVVQPLDRSEVLVRLTGLHLEHGG